MNIQTAVLSDVTPITTTRAPNELAAFTKEEELLIRQTNETITQVTQQLNDKIFNVAIALFMKYLNHVEKFVQDTEASRTLTPSMMKQLQSVILLDGLENLVKLLAPLAPHITAELYPTLLTCKQLLYAKCGLTLPSHFTTTQVDIHTVAWPTQCSFQLSAESLSAVPVKVIVMFGKKRMGEMEMDRQLLGQEEAIKDCVVQSQEFQNLFQNVSIKKFIYAGPKDKVKDAKKMKEIAHVVVNFVLE